VQKHRERPAVPAIDELVGDQPLPGRSTRPEPRLDRGGQQFLEPTALAADTLSELRHRAAHGLELAERLPRDVVGEIDGPGAAHPPGGPAHELLVDRRHELAEARLGLEASCRAPCRLHRIEPEDPRHLEALRFKLAPPVGTDVGIT
jgi:hypothetical protein